MPTLAPPSDGPKLPARARALQPAVNPSDAVQSNDLLKGQQSVVIEHNGASYRLQTTKLGKLILTK